MSLSNPNVCGPLSHLYGRHRRRLPREQSGRVVNLFTHLQLVIEFQTCQDLRTANMPHCNRYPFMVGGGGLMKIGSRATESGVKGAACTYNQTHTHTHTHTCNQICGLTLNIPSLGRQRCLPSWGPRRTPWFFCNFSTVWCVRLLKLCFLGFWNYNSVSQALLVSNVLCLFISTEVS